MTSIERRMSIRFRLRVRLKEAVGATWAGTMDNAAS
jgi:hypothetical protein